MEHNLINDMKTKPNTTKISYKNIQMKKLECNLTNS